MAKKKKDNFNGELPTYLFHQGTNYNAYEFMGAHLSCQNGANGVIFRTWAPRADSVSVVGGFNNWDLNANPMIRLTDGGLYEVFVPGVFEFSNYKFAITKEDKTVFKADPYAFYSECAGGKSSIVYSLDGYNWGDSDFLKNKKAPYSSPVNIYEVNLASWKRHDDGSYYTYREYAEELVSYLKEMNYTHLELMPLSEYPFDGSWGYQVTGYYSITSRFGKPKDFMYFVDCCHRAGISVILDWVPAHFPKDEHGLYEFDGTYCYENQGWDRLEHKTWGTRIFDWGRNEVQSFLISNAIFLFDKFHIDGIRVDAVSSMLYLDYDRKDGEWIPNENGGNYNLQAIAFLQKLNGVVFERFPNAMMIAEESTAYPMVTKPTYLGGLGFNFKWNMGWMNDSLSYVKTDPYFRSYEHNKLTFSMCYAFSENYILPVSHDEVVHGKKSLLDKMPGNIEDKFANHRAFLTYMYSHPGKKLNFMGNEFGQFKEWNYKEGLEFFLKDYELHEKLSDFVKQLNLIYKTSRPLYEIEDSWDGFNWISAEERDNNVVIYERADSDKNKIICIVNFSGNDYPNYRVGVEKGKYKIILSSDDRKFGGRGLNSVKTIKSCSRHGAHGKKNSVKINLAKFSGIYLKKIEE